MPTKFTVPGDGGRKELHIVVDSERRDDDGWMVYTRFVDIDGKIKDAKFKRAENGEMERW